MTQHFNDVVRLTSMAKKPLPLNDKRRSDTFASHFVKYYPANETAQQLHENIEFDVLWQGNPLLCVKMLKTPKCCICTMERMYILKLGKTEKLGNRRSKFYGACKQNPKLHRFNTDDHRGEKVEMDRPVRRTPNGFTFNPVGQTLAAVQRYSKLQGTSLAFTGHSGFEDRFPYCQTIQ
eukprot:386159-Ditylum_brightwellii.AAC.1